MFAFTFVMAWLFVLNEYNQLKIYKKDYINLWNLLDLMAYFLPIATCILECIAIYDPKKIGQSYRVIRIISACAIFMTWIKMLQFARGNKFTL